MCTHVVVEGRVQHVGFRAWTQRQATRLGLTGWVRNRDDGTVEALLCGPSDAVDDMVQALHQGPSMAVVRRLIQSQAASAVPTHGFDIRR